ncbi:hypothetical protein QRD43_20430 [Pelomonas sp. APW6]|uniref:Uncharacterized protein n=1 Tax=Roseateles subflavus TaxID=3053353 RepID=A0ABT7LN54_9BURK|nr:hypothetical protein [Pelomonas sp. APW6]MDL5034280.1 hypothetical protein [Pelomonas sp. APW6]
MDTTQQRMQLASLRMQAALERHLAFALSSLGLPVDQAAVEEADRQLREAGPRFVGRLSATGTVPRNAYDEHPCYAYYASETGGWRRLPELTLQDAQRQVIELYQETVEPEMEPAFSLFRLELFDVTGELLQVGRFHQGRGLSRPWCEWLSLPAPEDWPGMRARSVELDDQIAAIHRDPHRQSFDKHNATEPLEEERDRLELLLKCAQASARVVGGAETLGRIAPATLVGEAVASSTWAGNLERYAVPRSWEAWVARAKATVARLTPFDDADPFAAKLAEFVELHNRESVSPEAWAAWVQAAAHLTTHHAYEDDEADFDADSHPSVAGT